MHRTAICCAGCALRLLCAAFATCCAVIAICCACCAGCACYVIRLYIYTVCFVSISHAAIYTVLAACFVSIYILCAIRHHMPCCYIYCACYVLCWLCASSLYIYCVQFVTICLLRTQSRPKFYSGVKKKPFAQQKATEILQRCKETVACAAKSGRNCAAE